jgi:pimeloyl-ACP methyl ester carboxylesterase
MDYEIILLHGWGADSTRFTLLKDKLTAYGYHVIAYDMPGFGIAAPPEVPWGVVDYARWLDRQLDALKTKKIILLGHSFGGQVAVKYCELYPEKVKKLILISPAAVRFPRSMKKWFWATIAEGGKFVMSLPGLKHFYHYARWFLYRIIGQADYYKANGVMRDTLKIVLNEDLRRIFEVINVPTLLVWGTEDVFTPYSMHTIYTQSFPNITFKPYSEKGHNFFYTEASELAHDIQDFINTV